MAKCKRAYDKFLANIMNMKQTGEKNLSRPQINSPLSKHPNSFVQAFQIHNRWTICIWSRRQIRCFERTVEWKLARHCRFQIAVLVQYGSGWSRFYQLTGLGVFCCVLFIRNWGFDGRSPSVFAKQIIHDLVASCIVIDIDKLLVKIWK